MMILDIIGGVLSALAVGWLGWTSKTLDKHGQALAVLITQVSPANTLALPQILAQHTAQIGVNSMRIDRLDKLHE